MTISTDSQQEILDAISAAQDFFMQHFEKGPVDLYNKAYSHGLKLSNAKLWIKGQALTIADLDAELLAVREAQSVPAPIAFSENADADMCRTWAWEQVKKDVTTDSWTIGDSGNFYGFYCWGWDMRRQYNEQRAPAVPAELLDAMTEVIRISDRDHEAWGRAKAAISACRATMLQSCDRVRDLSTPVDPQIAEYEQSLHQLSGNSEPVSQGYTLPEGYKLVPIEPTEAMVIDGFESDAWDALVSAVLKHKSWPYSCRESAECVTGIFKAMSGSSTDTGG